jgi:uncharacterized membrane protein YkoI
MTKKKKLVIAVVAALAVIGIGTGAVLAVSGDDDRPLTGDPRARAMAAALEHLGGGEVIETEVGDDGAAYGVEILRPDGSVVEVNLDEDFRVIGSEADDDSAGESDGPNDD